MPRFPQEDQVTEALAGDSQNLPGNGKTAGEGPGTPEMEEAFSCQRCSIPRHSERASVLRRQRERRF